MERIPEDLIPSIMMMAAKPQDAGLCRDIRWFGYIRSNRTDTNVASSVIIYRAVNRFIWNTERFKTCGIFRFKKYVKERDLTNLKLYVAKEFPEHFFAINLFHNIYIIDLFHKYLDSIDFVI